MRKKSFILIIIACLLGISILFALRSKKQSPPTFINQNNSTAAQNKDQKEQNEEPITAEYTDGITLDIFQPQPGSTITNQNITVKGRTAPEADVFINDAELKADTQGYFSTNLTLDEGENPIVIVVNDTNGNSAEKEILVTYDPQL